MSMLGEFRHVTDDDIRRLVTSPDDVTQLFEDDGAQADGRLSVDKSWHALHWLLTGSDFEGDPPLNFIATGGTEFGDDLGYGPPRAFTSAEVRTVDEALRPISTAGLLARYDGGAMCDLYPGGWDIPEERANNLDDLARNYDALKGFVARAREQGLGLVAFLS
jgi:hypothetical protein